MRAKKPLPPERTAGEKLTAREAVWGLYIPLILSPTRVGKGVKGKTKGRAMTLRESRNRDALPGVVPLPERSGVGFAI